MTVENFIRALADVASQCMAPEKVSGSLEDFCNRVILPLNEVLLKARSEDLERALELRQKQEVRRQLEVASSGLHKLFMSYAADLSRRAFWNSDCVTRFAVDFDFLAEVSNLPLQRMFQDACQHSSSMKADEKLYVEGFSLFLLMLANKIHSSQVGAAEDRVPMLFNRINAIACTATHAPHFGLSKEPLLPVPKDSLRRSSIQSATSGFEEARRSDEAGLSWDELINCSF
ncbi:unnamed protein product [Effrenium voratum]|nr:unnamed protein product [Effrenium voratum]